MAEVKAPPTLDELNLRRLDRTRLSALAQMDYALKGQQVRRVPEMPIAWFVSRELHKGQYQEVLSIARWQSTGRCGRHRIGLSEMVYMGGTLFAFSYGVRAVDVGRNPDTGARMKTREPIRWTFDSASYDMWPADQGNPYWQNGTPADRKAAALVPAIFKHTYGLVPPTPKQSEYLGKHRVHYDKAVRAALINHMPPGFALLPSSKKPRAYQIQTRLAHGVPQAFVQTATARVNQPQGGIGVCTEEYLRFKSYPLYGSLRLGGVTYHVAPDGKTLYVKGGDTDIYHYAPQLTVDRDMMTFYEYAPPGALIVPGELAHYELDGPRRLVNFYWYLPTGEQMEETVGMVRGTVLWRGVLFFVLPTGALLPAVK